METRYSQAIIIWVLLLAATAIGADEVQFNRDIRPILSDNCFACHGPDAKHREAELRLDARDSAVASREPNAAIVPGNAAASGLIERITATDPDLKMPPEESGRKLTPAQIDLLKRWIEQGAKYEQHWSLIGPRRPETPATKDRSWPRNDIDRFVLARLETEGLRPSPEAAKETWLRRVTLDLTGLPPSIKELDQFLADTAPAAYERVVDRLLASERFGERMAMQWLDLARYADTNGYNNDEERTQWLWRDWVIDAFNRNMPYDQFLIEQLAGDLLPNPTLSQRIATAFNRNHVFTTEGGIIEEEYRVEYVADRVHTTATVFLGLSMQCARCHDHKFDPLSQRDYYRFFAFFNNINERTVGYNAARVSEPTVRAPSRQQEVEIERLDALLADLNRRRTEREADAAQEQAAWEAATLKSLAAGETKPSLGTGLLVHLPLDESGGDTVANAVDPTKTGKVAGPVKWSTGKLGGALELDVQGHLDLGDVGAFEHSDTFSLAAWVYLTSKDPSTVLSKMDEASAHRGYDLIIEQGRPAMHLVHRWDADGLKVIAKEAISLNTWHHVVMTYDGSHKAAGIKLFVDGKEAELEATNDKLSGSATIKTDKPFHVGRRSASAPFYGKLDDIRLYGVKLFPEDVAHLAAGQEITGLADILKTPSAERTAAQNDQLRRYYLASVDKVWRELTAEITSVSKQKADFEAAFPVTMVMQEMPQPRPAFILKRGQYDQPGEAVSAGVPESLPPLPEGAPANRLGLAQWLVSPAHPLTARVAVNRWWEMFFGTGLVETAEDFGSQGAWPTHPELLDHLAIRFSQGSDDSKAWDVKELLKQIVLSATYRQSSHVTKELLERDPKNRLLARGPRFRMPAETLRDNALAISGLLAGGVGGPSVKPYQPDGLWQDVSVERRAVYQPSQGEDLYRRSMYTFWKRTCPPPDMTTFDAPDRETCTIRRARTNTPLQALVLMNDPTYLEAARKMAERVLKEGGQTSDSRVQYACRLALCRAARADEQKLLGDMLTQSQQRFAVKPDAAEKLLQVGASPRDQQLSSAELAAWTTVCNLILSLDEAITKE
jgi:hypothetical protein